MKYDKVLSFSAISLILLLATTAYAVPITQVDISSRPGKTLNFVAGGSFFFADEVLGSNNDFDIDNADGTNGMPLIGLTGDIEGTFTFPNPMGASSVAVTNPPGAVFTISDGTFTFSAPVSFVTLSEQGGPFGGIIGSVVLGIATYGGTNAGLLELASAPAGNLAISFQIGGGVDLDKLFTVGKNVSWSGTLNPVPEPTSLLLLGSGLAALGLRLRKKASKA